MPTLTNPKHELFAQQLASGLNANEAYVAAKYKSNRSNAAKLAKDKLVQKRISELLEEREALNAQATAIAIENLALTKEWVLDRLRENANRAMQIIPVVRDGKETGDFKYDGSVANRALELIGKELGMFIDRLQVKNVVPGISSEPITENDWEAQHTKPTEH